MTVIDEIAAERHRQIEAEGWTAEHDDQHTWSELARAGAWYALNADSHDYTDTCGVADPRSVAYRLFAGAPTRDWSLVSEPYAWPWDMSWWKPKDRRRDLIRAAALIVAEIERIDRAAEREKGRPALCDCERSHNGFGMVGRECDCLPPSAQEGGA